MKFGVGAFGKAANEAVAKSRLFVLVSPATFDGILKTLVLLVSCRP